MENKKEIKNKIKNHFIEMFMNSEISYVKQDTRTYATYDSWEDIQYVSSNLETDNRNYVFSIKKSHIRTYLKITILDKSNSWLDSLVLYNDLFYLKRKNPINDKILNITNVLDYEELFFAVKDDLSFMRKMKLEQLKEKLK